MTPDSCLADHLYSSIRHEVGLLGRDPTTTADGHWIERIASQLSKDTHLSLVLDGIDRLDSWGLVSADKLPENIRLIVTSSTMPKDIRGWTVQSAIPRGQHPPAIPRSTLLADSQLATPDGKQETILTEFFDRAERQFPAELVGKTCAALTLAPNWTLAELNRCLQQTVNDHSVIQQHLAALIQFFGKIKQKRIRRFHFLFPSRSFRHARHSRRQ